MKKKLKGLNDRWIKLSSFCMMCHDPEFPRCHRGVDCISAWAGAGEPSTAQSLSDTGLVSGQPRGRLAHNDDIMMEEEYDPRLGLYSLLYSQMWLNDDEGKSEEIFWECLTVFWSSGVRPLGTRGEFIIKRIAAVDGGTGQASTRARTQTV